jgi:hypothetical protein
MKGTEAERRILRQYPALRKLREPERSKEIARLLRQKRVLDMALVRELGRNRA